MIVSELSSVTWTACENMISINIYTPWYQLANTVSLPSKAIAVGAKTHNGGVIITFHSPTKEGCVDRTFYGYVNDQPHVDGLHSWIANLVHADGTHRTVYEVLDSSVHEDATQSENARLKAENAELKTKASRYDWILQYISDGKKICLTSCSANEVDRLVAGIMKDEAIDNRMRSEGNA